MSGKLNEPIIIDSDSADERSLHLHLETTSDVPESKSSVQKPSDNKARRIKVTTLQTFSSPNKTE